MKRLLFFLIIFFWLPLAFAVSADAYLVEIGQQYISQGRFQKAKTEFEKALQVNPANKRAKEYLNQLRKQEIKRTLNKYSKAKPASKRKSNQKATKDPDQFSPDESAVDQPEEKES
ncbi:MAG: tetratricopeptide repeat protein, partial [Candidatus Omnitrophota bacterium]